MSTKPFEKNTLELDLSFKSNHNDPILNHLDQSTLHQVKDRDSWEKDLKVWIQIVRTNEHLICHEVVRKAHLISLGLEFTDDLTIKKLNSKWRNKAEKTDVLSFPAIESDIFLPSNKLVELGDIIVSLPTAVQQAKEHNHDLQRELRWLVSHGLLHLLGWDHPNSKSLEQMLDLQEHLLQVQNRVQCNY